MPNPLIGMQMADGIFDALFRPAMLFGPALLNRTYAQPARCEAHNRPTDRTDRTCTHCDLDAAERVLVDAMRTFGDRDARPLSPALRVLCRAQFHLNVQRLSAEAAEAIELMDSHWASMGNLWCPLEDSND